MLAMVARAWGRIGEKDRAAGLLREAERAIANAQDIERPGIAAFVAAGWLSLGDTKEAWRIYGQAIDAAASLVNARPRALAAVEICRSVGREKAVLDPAARGRLETLHKGLKAPW
jgi:hypothetical protein